ncbi:unnamed protein product, partial [Rotaria magnacalcarata]
MAQMTISVAQMTNSDGTNDHFLVLRALLWYKPWAASRHGHGKQSSLDM